MNFNKIAPNVLRLTRYFKKRRSQIIKQDRMTYTYKLITILEGDMLFETCDGSWKCSTGSIIYIPAKYNYRIEFPPYEVTLMNVEFDMLHDRDTSMPTPRKFFISSHEGIVKEYFSTLVTFDNAEILNRSLVIEKFPQIIKRSHDCVSLWKSMNKYSLLLLNTKITELLVDIVEFAEESKRAPYSEISDQILQYIRSHCSDRLTCNDIAAAFSYHRTSINRIIRDRYNCSLHKLILREKISIAADLIKENEMSISDIAYHLCFYDSAHFSKVFREFMGCNPSDLRHKNNLAKKDTET